MTRDEVIERLMRIECALGDHELAHGLEDELHVRVLLAIADGAPNPADLAKLALHTLLFKFRRSCA